MSSTPQPPQEIVVSDVRMRFGSMVVFMVKWAVAAIPALLILIAIGVAASVFVGGLITSLRGIPSGKSAVSARATEEPKGTVAVGSVQVTPADPVAVAYLDKVLVRKVEVGQSVLGEPGVFGEIKNQGDRTVKEVEITIFCLGPDGMPVFEKTYHPVLVSDLSFGDAAQPLKPGYSRQFGVKLDDAPSDWVKKVDVRVTRVQLQ